MDPFCVGVIIGTIAWIGREEFKAREIRKRGKNKDDLIFRQSSVIEEMENEAVLMSVQIDKLQDSLDKANKKIADLDSLLETASKIIVDIRKPIN